MKCATESQKYEYVLPKTTDFQMLGKSEIIINLWKNIGTLAWMDREENKNPYKATAQNIIEKIKEIT